MMRDELVFFQLFDTESSTYTYLLGDKRSRDACLIDPVLERANRDLQLLKELGLTLRYTLETHAHADHITGANALRERTGCQVAISADSGAQGAEILLTDEHVLHVGEIAVRAVATPGHTAGCMSFIVGDRVFTGDALLIRGTGRTDFQGGSPEVLYQSIQTKLFSLPDTTRVFPAHDYNGVPYSTIGLEKQFNPRLGGGKTREEFVSIMNNLKLPEPKKIAVAVPANLRCGKLT